MNPKIVRRIILASLIIILLVILFSPFKIPYSFDVTGRIYHAKEWKLIKETNGSFYSIMVDNYSGMKSHFTNYEFERGDIANIRINGKLEKSVYIHKNDSIAHITTLLIDEQILNLENQLLIEEALLKTNTSGLRIEDIEIAEEELKFTKQQLEQQELRFARFEKLYEDSVYTDKIYEEELNLLKLAKIQVSIAEKKLLASESGNKPEEIQLIKTRIKSLEKEIANLKQRKLNYTILSPMSGKISLNNLPEEILTICEPNKYILIAPVQVNNRQYLTDSSQIKFLAPNSEGQISLSISQVNDYVGLINNQQTILTKTIIKSDQDSYSSGMVVKCQIVCAPVTIFEYFKRATKITIR
ncbi:MAG: hypothetical protein HN704_03910 [Bacteroidetes bacterium]|jgi:hypothetical protein|nr:hypothetical protein [Bacteroidota bacterium]MBT6684794.1 hypothetical protein [Bacteroidota bacterium]MBT7141770.1 hypothetical protein [Bacteroidota bacterium]MBT7490738.1 hypothetical protein [Bacteroidota bacterium]